MKFKRYDTRKMFTFLSIFFWIGIVLYTFFVFEINGRVKKIDTSNLKIPSQGQIEYCIENIRDDLDYIMITGYAYEPGISSSQILVKIDLLICDESTKQYYELPTENMLRTDITESVNDGCDYRYAGFKSVSAKKNLPDQYHIAILYERNGEKMLIDEGKNEK